MARCVIAVPGRLLASVAAMTSMTRGPLPARVYWTRRILVIAVALLLVLGIAKVLTLGSDGSSDPQARQVAAEPTQSGTVTTTPSSSPTKGTKKNKQDKRPGKGKKTSEAPVLAQPNGPCADEDIAITPEVKRSVAGPHGEVLVALVLRTLDSEACTWRVSHDTVTMKISSGKDDIWSSRQCPRAIPVTSVVVRKAVSTTVDVTWSGRRSDDECSRMTQWALPGFYHVTAAALAGEPADEQFELTAPQGAVVTTSPSPQADPVKDKGKKKNKNKNKQKNQNGAG